MIVDKFAEKEKKRGRPKQIKDDDKDLKLDKPEDSENEPEEKSDEPEKLEETQIATKTQAKKERIVVVLIRNLFNHKDQKDYPMGEQSGDDRLIELAETKKKNDQGFIMVKFPKDLKNGS